MLLPSLLPSLLSSHLSRKSSKLPFVVAALTTAALAAITWPGLCAAQEPTPSLASSAPQAIPIKPSFLSRLQGAEWDPAVRGPLLVVVPSPYINSISSINSAAPLPRTRLTLHAIGTAAEMRLVPAGRVTALVPRMSAVINTRPGKANPFSGLNASETLTLLLASFTPAQWQQIGSANGIGMGDLTDDQRLLWTQMMPEKARVTKSTMKPGEQPGSWNFTDPTSTEVRPRETGRLRLSKAVDFSFYKVGAKDTSWGGDPYNSRYKDGAAVYNLSSFSDRRAGALPNSAYGVQLVSPQATRLKSGAVDFAAPGLNVPISLTGFPQRPVASAPAATASTAAPVAAAGTPAAAAQQAYRDAQAELLTLPPVADVLLRISKATRLEFVADRRVRDLPVYLRGDSARAGDLLMAVCGSVGGTFRKIEPGGSGKEDSAPLYLLTDGVAGIGTRVAALLEWAEEARTRKRRMTDGATEAAAKNDPLSRLSFAPDDEYALPAAQTKQLEDSWRSKKYGATPDVPFADMTPALRQAVQSFADDRAKEGILIDTTRVRIGQKLKPYLLVPEMGDVAVEALDLGNIIGHQYLQQVAFDPSRNPSAPAAIPPAAGKTPVPPVGFADPTLKKQRRVVIARPATAEEAAGIVRAAAGRGITGVWLETSLEDLKTATALLTAAVKAGGTKIAVGGVVRLLKGGGLAGEADRNILGETGDEYQARRLTSYTEDKKYLESYRASLGGFTGWIVPNPSQAAEMELRVKVLAAVPGLASLTFRATGGPGWTGQKDGGDGLWTNSAGGYTPSMRRAFLRERGMDPIDIPDTRWDFGEIRWDLGYFKATDPGSEYEVIDGKLVRRGGDAVPRTSWWEYRLRRNTALLAALFQTVRKDHPALPLLLEDRNGGFTRSNTGFFASWDTPERLPDTSPFTVESETRAAARRTSKEIWAHWGSWWGEVESARAYAPETFALQVSASALRNPPPAWDGLVLDLSGVPGASVARMLGGLPLHSGVE
ncbi:MAG: hypothetical protein V4671_04700 [Armatimonadota bacterium]